MTDTDQPDTRHLSAESFDRCLSSGVPMEHPIKGEPPVTLFIDPDRHEIGIRVPAGDEYKPADIAREHVRVILVHRPEGRFVEIVIDDPSLFSAAYPVLRAIADRIQLDGLDVMSAASSTIRLLDQLLRRDIRLSVEREIGLFGELLVVHRLCSTLSVADAIAAWRSGDSEEHDFSIYDVDVEVKTTSAERRTHWITSLTQLLPTGERALWLISQQITRAGPGSGQRLAELIADIRALVGGDAAREVLEHHLADAGWNDIYDRTLRDRWLIRTPPQAYLVDEDFPRLTPSILDKAEISMLRISELRYRVDLTGLVTGDQPPEIVKSLLSVEGAS